MAKLIYPPEGGAFYKCDYTINSRSIKRLIISNHYKKKHSKYMSDELIIKFIEEYLDGESYYDGEKDGEWEYFELEPILYKDKNYILVWLFNENIPDFLGIVHCRYSNIKVDNYEKKSNVSFFPPEERLAKIREKMLEPNYPRVNRPLPKNATSLEKSKYFLCKKVLVYKQENNLPVEKLAKQVNLTVPEVEDILFARIDKFTLDRLVAYIDNLFPFHLVVHQELLTTSRKTSNSRIRKHA